MKADVDGAARIARIASGFDWEWSDRDIPRFCQAAGWRVLHDDRRFGATLGTNLAVPLAMCNVAYDTRLMGTRGSVGEKIAEMRVYVAGSEGAAATEPLPVAVAREFRTRLVEELGPWSEHVGREQDQCFYWRRSGVVVGLALNKSFVLLKVLNPRYERWVKATAAQGAPRRGGAGKI
ncbi:DUF6301 family protein [Bacillus cereus]|uniref:DUF6301 family protein n=1 Tax=Bacillus cereus TaxID=1396 RepID=UPI0036726A50